MASYLYITAEKAINGIIMKILKQERKQKQNKPVKSILSWIRCITRYSDIIQNRNVYRTRKSILYTVTNRIGNQLSGVWILGDIK